MPTPNLIADFTPAAENEVLAPLVYLRSRWSYDWELQPYLRVNYVQSATSPGTGAAELAWRYGRIKQAEQQTRQLYAPYDGLRRYVKIVFPNVQHDIGGEIAAFKWYGIVNGVAARAGGIGLDPTGAFETGIQTLQCVALEKILDEVVIRTSAWEQEGTRFFVDRGLTFNAERADGTSGGNLSNPVRWPAGQPIYSGQVRDDDEFWTADFMLQYLLYYHRPKDAGGGELPLGIDPDLFADVLSFSRDRPRIATHGRTLRSLLDQILTHKRFINWRLEVIDELNVMVIRASSLAGEQIVLTSGDIIQANTRRWEIFNDASRTDGALLVLSHAESLDRVFMRGSRASATCTISRADTTFVQGYTAGQKTLYDNGAEGSAPYIAAEGDDDALNKLHKQRRSRDDVKMVYALFRIPDDWDFVAKNGEGVGGASIFAPIITELGDSFLPYQRELYIEPYTAMRDGYAYENIGGGVADIPPVKYTSGPFNNRPPVVFIKIPAEGIDADELTAHPRYVNIESIGTCSHEESAVDDASFTWSAHVSVPKFDRALFLKVTGAEQWMIAGADYTQDKDEEELTYVWDWRTIIATVTIKLDAYCEGVWPPHDLLPANDYIREALFDAGPEYRLDWLVPGTVTGLDDAGQLRRSALGGWIQNDRIKLLDRAILAFSWYGIERRSVQIPTSKINGSIRLGDFICTVGRAVAHTINTVVTGIRIDCGPGQGNVALPLLTFTTDYVADLELFLSQDAADAMGPRLSKLTSTRSERGQRP